MAKFIIPTFEWFKTTYDEFGKAKASERDQLTGEKLLKLGIAAREMPTYLPFTEFIFDLAHSKNIEKEGIKEGISEICRLAGYTGNEAELSEMLCVKEITFSKWISKTDTNHRNPSVHTFYHIAYIVALNILSKL